MGALLKPPALCQEGNARGPRPATLPGPLSFPSRSGCPCSDDGVFIYSMKPTAPTACGNQLTACRALSPAGGSHAASHQERGGLQRREVVPSTQAEGEQNRETAYKTGRSPEPQQEEGG